MGRILYHPHPKTASDGTRNFSRRHDLLLPHLQPMSKSEKQVQNRLPQDPTKGPGRKKRRPTKMVGHYWCFYKMGANGYDGLIYAEPRLREGYGDGVILMNGHESEVCYRSFLTSAMLTGNAPGIRFPVASTQTQFIGHRVRHLSPLVITSSDTPALARKTLLSDYGMSQYHLLRCSPP